ncbi:lactonase family protein [Asticcacaulis sp. AND118]|uniref:lactonase family protein n=1 Tax=Asticcacaulis sp. AND118 TaxID=2840468 RepID=UPI001D000B56|nr:lactonase family protein [Asticcacaulis sp. AND118]UDF02855.1 lactonase family protein [Asticcacaulis sp. AND118]
MTPVDRRGILLGMGAIGVAGAARADAPQRMLIGTYSGEGGRGLELWTRDGAGRYAFLKAFPEIADASFGVIDRTRSVLYVTGERDKGRIAAWRVRGKGATMTPLGSVSSQAGAPCYLALSPGNSHLAVANYFGDTVALCPLHRQSGAIQPASQTLHAAVGSEPKGHAHWVQWSPDGRHIYVVDLGHDEVRVYDWDPVAGRVGPPRTALKLQTGAGPRHMAVSPVAGQAFVFTEYSNELIAVRIAADGRLEETARLSSLPDDFAGKSSGAHIVVNAKGDRVYVSNRGHNSLAVFAATPEGRLKRLQVISTGGDWPRFFRLMNGRLLVAHQRDHRVTEFSLKSDGTLTPTGKGFVAHRPVYIETL